MKLANKAMKRDTAAGLLPDGGLIVDELLLQIEMAESAEEQEELQRGLDELVASDEEAARSYQIHCMLERELRALFENPCFASQRRMSPFRPFFHRLWMRFRPGPVG